MLLKLVKFYKKIINVIIIYFDEFSIFKECLNKWSNVFEEVIEMYKLVVNSNYYDLTPYLEREVSSEEKEPHKYIFENREHALKVISRFMFYFLREEHLNELFKFENINTTKREEFLLYVPSDKVSSIFHSIQNKLDLFLQDLDELNFDGFVNFRLQNEKKEINYILRETFEDFKSYDGSDENLNELKDILEKQSSKINSVYLIVEKNDEIILRDDKKVYLKDIAKNEDVVLSHLIMLAPKEVKVFETHGQFSKETTIILRHIFKDKVDFTQEEFMGKK